MIIMMLTMVITAPMMAIGGIILALSQDAQLAWVLIAVMPVMAVVFALIMRAAVPLSTAMQVKIDRLNLVLGEGLSGVRVIRAFDRGNRQRARFDQANLDLTDTAIAVNRLTAVLMPALVLMLNMTSVAIIWVGSHRIDAGLMQVGAMFSSLQYAMQILFAVFMVTAMFIMLPRASASAARIHEVLDSSRRSPIRRPGRGPGPPPRAGTSNSGTSPFSIRRRGTGAHRCVVHGSSRRGHRHRRRHRIENRPWPGSSRASMTPSTARCCSTASTCARWPRPICARAWDSSRRRPCSSAERLPPTSATAARTRPTTKYAMPRRSRRPSTSSRRCRSSSPRRSHRAASTCRAVRSSGLSIARALVRRPDVYVFDDSFSALDFTTDARLRAALRAETARATVFIVAQRISTVMTADRIVVLDEGRVVGIGTHAELLTEQRDLPRDCVVAISLHEVA